NFRIGNDIPVLYQKINSPAYTHGGRTSVFHGWQLIDITARGRDKGDATLRPQRKNRKKTLLAEKLCQCRFHPFKMKRCLYIFEHAFDLVVAYVPYASLVRVVNLPLWLKCAILNSLADISICLSERHPF